MLLKFAYEVLDSNALWWVKIQNGMKIFNVSLFYRKFLKFLPTIVHLSPELQKPIPGGSSGEIPPRLIQVNSLAPLFHFDIKILNFHGQFNFLGHPNLGILAHTEIGHIFAYRAHHAQKMP